MKLLILEYPEGGYCLRPDQPAGPLLTTGRFATPTDALRVARLNGYQAELKHLDDVFQMELPLQPQALPLSA
jgi:hypothetical protein